MKRRSQLAAALVAASAAAALTSVTGASGQAPTTGEIGPSLGITGNGRLLQPAGRQTTLGNFPTGGALTPDGRFYWAVDAGHGSDDVKVVDVASGAVVQTLPLPGGYVGVAFAPDGRSAYVSGTAKGDSPTEGATKGDKGDVVHVFSVDPASGRASEQDPIALPSTSNGSGQTNSLPPVSAGWPEGLAVSPDGSKLVVALNQADQAAIVNLADRKVTLVKVGAYPYGVAIDPSGGSAYVSNELDGTVSVVDLTGARVTATIPVGGPDGDKQAHPEGMAVDSHRAALYVAVTNRDLVAVVDTHSHVVRYVSVARPEALGTAPVAVSLAPDGRTLYSANAGDDSVAAISLADRPTNAQAARQTHVVYAVRSPREFLVLYPRAVAAANRRLRRDLRRAHTRARQTRVRRAYRRTISRLKARYLFGAARRACTGPSRAQDAAYRAAVTRAQRARKRALRRARRSARRRRAAERGYQAALAKARRRLPAVAQCGAAAGDIPGLPAFTLIGRIPTAAYTTDVQVTPDGSKLVWLAGKGYGAGPNPDYVFAGSKVVFGNVQSPFGTYVLDKLAGRAGVLARPTDVVARGYSPTTDAVVRTSDPEQPPAGTPLVGPGGGASDKIKHVFYIVRENRTYDQVFGTDPRGDGSPRLELFDDNNAPGPTSGITPNAHALARQFPLLDHVYADSEVSVDGHLITAGGYATDYVQKATAANYSGRGRAFDFGIFPITFPPKDFVFDQAVRQGVPFHNYGEQGAGTTPFANDGRSTYGPVQSNTDPSYPGNLQIGCLSGSSALQGSQPSATAVGNRLTTCTQDSGVYGPNTTVTSTQPRRVDVFRSAFQAQVAAGNVPALNYMILPNDHTNGTTANAYTPSALIADNDLALGQIVDIISHSSIWSSSAIFVVEDDTQDGADHVDAHRMPAFAISPYTVKGAVHTRYDQYSVLRTVELILGMKPLALTDAFATPMYDAFANGSSPDTTPYTAIEPQQSLTEANPSSGPLAKAAARLPFARPDMVPQAVLDGLLWRSVYGARSRPPGSGPNFSPVEHARAVGALRILARGGNAKAWLARHTGPDSADPKGR